MAPAACAADPVLADQAGFRAVMEAMARPGRICPVPAAAAPAPLLPAAAALARALFDYETPVWLDAPLAAAPEVAAFLRFATGAPIAAAPANAAFALIADACALPAFDSFAPGTPDYPDRSTTLIVQIESFENGRPLALSGPGIKDTHAIAPAPLPADFVARLAANRALFPRGVDLVLAGPQAIAALPRSVRVVGT